METPDKTKVSSNFILTKLTMFGGIVFCVFKFFEARKTDDLFTEFWFLVFFVLLSFLIYYFTRPNVYSDNSSFYFKKFNKPEIQVSFKDIQIIVINPISVRGNSTYKIQYLDKTGNKDRILFYTDSYKPMQNLISLVRESNRFVKIL